MCIWELLRVCNQDFCLPLLPPDPNMCMSGYYKLSINAPAEHNADADGKALYKDTPFQTAAGEVTSSIGEGTIS